MGMDFTGLGLIRNLVGLVFKLGLGFGSKCQFDLSVPVWCGGNTVKGVEKKKLLLLFILRERKIYLNKIKL